LQAHDRLYRGEWHKDGATVTVHESPGHSQPLGEEPFAWGTRNRKARALALAILRDATGGPAGPDLSEEFTVEVLASLPPLDPFILWRSEVEGWVQSHHPAQQLAQPAER
jgi:hypothetical protein